tara:strand:- start:281 stop:2131 length:1851 start_codon:yes stop_codon:yes gene_type:complete
VAKAQADIEIAVRGINQLKEARTTTQQLSKEINKLTRDAAKDVFGKLPKNSKSLVRSTNNLNQVLSDARANFNKVAVGTDAARKAAINLVDAEEEVNKTLAEQNKLIQQIKRSRGTGGIRGALFGQGEEQVQRRRQALSSGAIGGAFPLLFGQGGGAALGGAVGGAAGGLMGGQFGFALSLVGTQLGAAVDNFVKGAASVGQALNPLTADLDALVTSLGFTGTAEAERIKLIEQAQGKQAALNAVTAEMNQVLGADAVESLKRFGETSRLIGNNFSQALLKLQGALAPVLETIAKFVSKTTGAEQGEIDRLSKSRIGTDPEAVAIQRRIAELQGQTGGGRSGVKQRQDEIRLLKAQLEERKKILAEQKKEDILTSNKNKKLDIALNKIEEENKLFNATLDGRREEFLIKQQIDEILKSMDLTEKDINDTQLDRIKNAVKNNAELKKQVDLAKQVKDAFESLSKSINNDIKEGIKGLIKGTSTLGDLLNNVADRFLDVALNQALFGSILGSEGTKGGGLLGAIGLFANGGRPPVGKPSIVGEKGPELFVPSSSGTIVPNNKLGGGGSTSVVVNVDASGSDVQGDDAGAKELGTLISVAVQGELLKQQRPGGLLSSLR